MNALSKFAPSYDDWLRTAHVEMPASGMTTFWGSAPVLGLQSSDWYKRNAYDSFVNQQRARAKEEAEIDEIRARSEAMRNFGKMPDFWSNLKTPDLPTYNAPKYEAPVNPFARTAEPPTAFMPSNNAMRMFK